MDWDDEVKFESLVGKELIRFEVNADKDRVEIETTAGEKFVMFHSQDCCESVRVEDVIGDLKDLIGASIVRAEENSSASWPDDVSEDGYYLESFTWTFYRIGTQKGTVVLRWLGRSNGYYSESVSFEKISENNS